MSDFLASLDAFSGRQRPSLDAVQAEAIERLFGEWDNGAKGRFFNLATGTGKTATAAKVTERHLEEVGGRVLFLCDRKELIDQAAAEFEERGIGVAIEQAERSARSAVLHPLSSVQVVVGSVDTLQGSRLESWPRDAFSLVIPDEAHCSLVPTWRKTLDYFDAARYLYLTATDFRTDGVPLYGVPGSLVEDGGLREAYPLEGLPEGSMVPRAVAFRYPILSAIRNGHLSPITCVTCPIDVDLRAIKTSRNGKSKDFNAEQLALRIEQNLGKILLAFRQEMDRRGIDQAFAAFPGVDCARHAAQMFNDRLGVSARAVWSGNRRNPLPDSERSAIVGGFKAGDFRVICFDTLLATGVNHPPAHLLTARPTKSLVLMTQLLGRATRKFPGIPVKFCVDADWKGCEDVVTPPDVFLEHCANPRVKANYKRLKRVSKGVVNPVELLDRAEKMAEQDEAREKERAARKQVSLHVGRDIPHYRPIEFTPIKAAELMGLDHKVRELEVHAHESPTPAELAVAAELGFRDATGLNRKQLRAVIEDCMDREFHGLANAEQIVKLVERGHTAEVARKMTANRAADELRRPRPLTEKEAEMWRKVRKTEPEGVTVEDYRRFMATLRR